MPVVVEVVLIQAQQGQPHMAVVMVEQLMLEYMVL